MRKYVYLYHLKKNNNKKDVVKIDNYIYNVYILN